MVISNIIAIVQNNPLISILVILVVGYMVYNRLLEKEDDDDALSDDEEPTKFKMMTRKEVSLHNKETDLWVIVDDWVYDLTKFASVHPGGVNVLITAAGDDCSLKFHGAQHTRNAYENIRTYKIGHIVKEERTKYLENLDEGYFTKGRKVYDGIRAQKDGLSTKSKPKELAPYFVGYTMTPISKFTLSTHNYPNDSWIAIEGKVYNVSDFQHEHPGGIVIIQGRGQDVTEEWKRVNHSQNAIKMMSRFYVGPMGKETQAIA